GVALNLLKRFRLDALLIDELQIVSQANLIDGNFGSRHILHIFCGMCVLVGLNCTLIHPLSIALYNYLLFHTNFNTHQTNLKGNSSINEIILPKDSGFFSFLTFCLAFVVLCFGSRYCDAEKLTCLGLNFTPGKCTARSANLASSF